MGKWVTLEDEPNKRRGFSMAVDPARVRASVGVTHNLGDFNGVRIDISVEDNLGDGESIDDAINRVYATAEKVVELKLSEYEED